MLFIIGPDPLHMLHMLEIRKLYTKWNHPLEDIIELQERYTISLESSNPSPQEGLLLECALISKNEPKYLLLFCHFHHITKLNVSDSWVRLTPHIP